MADEPKGPGNALAELRARMSAATQATPGQVISLKTRKVYEPSETATTVTVTNGRVDETPAKAKRPRQPRIDKASIERAEELLAMLKSGEAHGFLGLTTMRESGAFCMFMSMREGPGILQEAFRYVGGLELVKEDLLMLADLGPVSDEDEVVLMMGDDE